MNILKPLLLLATSALLGLSAFAGPAEDLAAAEQNLRISKETLRQIENDLTAIKKDPTADAGVVREFETYAQRSRTIVTQQEAEVARLRRIAPAPAPIAPVLPARNAPGFQVAKPSVDMRKEIDQDPLARLDSLLNKSVADFDAKLLREMQQVEQARTSGAAGVGAAPGKEREMAQNEGQEGGEAGQEGEGQEGQVAQNGGKPGQEGGKPGQEGSQPGQEGGKPGEMRNGNQQASTRPGSAGQSSRNGSISGAPGTGTTSSTRGSRGGTDEDIVARQLREAAERESDPVLKEKLYKEYEAYKRGR